MNTNIDSKEKSPPLLEAININGNLGYKIYLMKPKELLTILAISIKIYLLKP
jgi:hypothetical protein